MNNQELEIKYYVANLKRLEARLRALGAQLVQARVHEVNLRFDTADGELGRTGQVLRLRQDMEARLTYKGAGRSQGGVQARQEIEFTVGDFEAARAFLEALGYCLTLMYEKFRATYDLDGVHVTLDELPYGDFAELEGPDPARIQAVNERLGLDWEQRIIGSYTGLFEKLRTRLGFTFQDLSFENFEGLAVLPEHMDVAPADG